MVRTALITAAALLMAGVSKPEALDYRLGVQRMASGLPVLDVELRLRGDADGETRFVLPESPTSELQVRGGKVSTLDSSHSVIRHRPRAKLAIRYAVRATGGDAEDGAALGESIFIVPEARETKAVTFRWKERPKGWQAATDLEHGAAGRPMTVADIRASVVIAGANLSVARRDSTSGTVRTAILADAAQAARLADIATPVVAATRAFWNDAGAPYLVVTGPFPGAPRDRGDGLVMAAGALGDPDLQGDLGRLQMRSQFAERLGRSAAGTAQPIWFTQGFADFFGDRSLLRADLMTPKAAAAGLAEADAGKHQARGGAVLALKWDEDIRRKTGGKADLDDVILRMRDHVQRFPPDRGPDIITGLVSAAWTVAGLDLRPDIVRYAEGGEVIPLPETLFDGCLDARVTVSPGFDSGFDHEGSFAAKTVRGVRRGGPAWNSGLRNGMRLEAWSFRAGEVNREVELTVRPTARRAKPRKLRFWPYGDADVEVRRLQFAAGLSEAEIAACGRRIGGL